jgi:pimeloyl-ACP methyl ester carboxylesterase
MKIASLVRTKRARRTAVALTGVAAAVATGAAFTGTAVGDTARAPQKPTIVLEHGAFADSSSWNGVMERLQKDGYPVIAAANPLRGPQSDAAALRGLLDHVQGPVVVVGHSYGGSVISEAAAGDSQVKALVYVAALVPAVGENAQDLLGKFPGSTLADALDPVSYKLPDGTTATDLYVDREKFPHQFAADVPANTAALMAATQRPIAQTALEEKATAAAWQTTPSWDVITTQDLNIPQATQEFMAKRAHAHTTEIRASHSVAVSHPEAVTRVVEQAAQATVK